MKTVSISRHAGRRMNERLKVKGMHSKEVMAENAITRGDLLDVESDRERGSVYLFDYNSFIYVVAEDRTLITVYEKKRFLHSLHDYQDRKHELFAQQGRYENDDTNGGND